jgi:hypothetical protein
MLSAFSRPEVTAAFQDQALLHNMEALVLNTTYDAQRLFNSVKRLVGLQVAAVAILTSQNRSGRDGFAGGTRRGRGVSRLRHVAEDLLVSMIILAADRRSRSCAPRFADLQRIRSTEPAGRGGPGVLNLSASSVWSCLTLLSAW